MNVEEIFKDISSHCIKGIMIHQQLSMFFEFLGLSGFAREQCEHYVEESKNYSTLLKKYIRHTNKLLPESRVDNPNIVPENWYRYYRQDVDGSTKRQAVKSGINKWINWEKDVKKLLENYYCELLNLKEIELASIVKCNIHDVCEEIRHAECIDLYLLPTDYNMSDILGYNENI